MFKKLFNSISKKNKENNSTLEGILNSPKMQNRMFYKIAFDNMPNEFYNNTYDFIYGVKTKNFTYGSWEKFQLSDSRTAFVVTFKQFNETDKVNFGDQEMPAPRAIYAAAILSNENSADEYFVLVEGPGRNYIRGVDKDLSSFNTTGMADPRFQSFDTASIENREDFLKKISL